MTINCIPDSIISWNYFLQGPGHEAIWQKKLTSEQGSILIDGVFYTIKKHGVTSCKWTIERNGEVVYTGIKPSAFRRSFQIEGMGKTYDLGPLSVFSRSMYFSCEGTVLALISPKHAFTRKAEIEILQDDADFPPIVFAFWLTILTWRRRQHNS